MDWSAENVRFERNRSVLGEVAVRRRRQSVQIDEEMSRRRDEAAANEGAVEAVVGIIEVVS